MLRTFLRDRPSQHCFGVFVASALYSLMVLREVGTSHVPVPGLAVTGAFLLVVASIFGFVFLVHHVAQSIRAVTIMDAVAAEARASLEENHPPVVHDPARDHPLPVGEARQVIALDRRPGVVLGIDEDDLVRLAQRYGCVLELVPTVGDYVVHGGAVFRVYEGTEVVPPRAALAHVGLGPERTLFQDTAFGIRQLVDMAEKALSPAVNDPTTAVQSLDRIHDLLRRLVTRPLSSGRYADDNGPCALSSPRSPGMTTCTWRSTRSATSGPGRCRSPGACGPPWPTCCRWPRPSGDRPLRPRSWPWPGRWRWPTSCPRTASGRWRPTSRACADLRRDRRRHG